VLLAKAMKTLVEEGDLEIIKIVSQSMVEIAEGEALELQVRGNFLLSKEEYLRILRMKTASFMECCCQVGALIGNITKEHQSLLGRYGHHIGMAFQIIDDLLDFKGHQSTTGKPRATDFREGCVTLPLIYLRSKMKKEESFFISKLFGNGALEEDIQVIHEWMEEREVYAETERYALSHVQKAQEFLQKFPDSPYKELMMQTSQAILNRQQ
jgi:octaprenyl-diphosphate synthase